MYRLFIETLSGRLVLYADGELAVLVRDYSTQFQLPGYQKIWRRTKQDGGAYADIVRGLKDDKLYLFKVVKINLLTPPPET